MTNNPDIQYRSRPLGVTFKKTDFKGLKLFENEPKI